MEFDTNRKSNESWFDGMNYLIDEELRQEAKKLYRSSLKIDYQIEPVHIQIDI